jgi:hypothetical protein
MIGKSIIEKRIVDDALKEWIFDLMKFQEKRTIYSSESFCTIPKQQRLNSDDHCSDSTDVDIFLD